METSQDIKAKLLSEHLEIELDSIEATSYDSSIFEVGSAEYLVVDDDEADQLWEESLENVLNGCVYPELPDHLAVYFNAEAWKSDAKLDGRGHSLSSYDGNKEEVQVDGILFYIYRVN